MSIIIGGRAGQGGCPPALENNGLTLGASITAGT